MTPGSSTGAGVPFNRPGPVGREAEYVLEAMRSGHLSGDGPFAKRCERMLGEELGARVLLTPSCTDALEAAALLLDTRPGDEVIVPSFTFPSTALGFVLRGARPVFVDVRADTLNLDETKLAGAITERTRAILVMHYAGIACEMDAIVEVAAARGVAIVEDNAHGLFGRYRGRPLGTFGRLATLSFHETKNFTAGEGGALVVNDPELLERAEILREKGTDRSRFFRGQVDKYSWVDLGSSYLPSELQAAFLAAQLEARVEVQRRRLEIWDRYQSGLGCWAADNSVQLPAPGPRIEHPAHLYYILLPDLATREAFRRHMAARGIDALFHYVPLHLSGMGNQFGGRVGDCPVAESVSDRLVRLPLFTDLRPAEQERVVEAALEFHA